MESVLEDLDSDIVLDQNTVSENEEDPPEEIEDQNINIVKRGSKKTTAKSDNRANEEEPSEESTTKSKHVWTQEERDKIQKYFKHSSLKIQKAPQKAQCELIKN